MIGGAWKYVIDGDEPSQMSSSMRRADANGDGKITLEELMTHLNGGRPAAAGASSGSSGSSNGGGLRKRSVRFRTASEPGLQCDKAVLPAHHFDYEHAIV